MGVTTTHNGEQIMCYENDHRVRAAQENKWWTSIDEDKMIATISLWDDEDLIEVPFQFEVCHTCDGKGKHVNPSIDCDGLTQRDFDEDPGFRESYMAGHYDVSCYGCGGRRVIPVMDENKIDPAILKRWNAQQEESRIDEAERRSERSMGA